MDEPGVDVSVILPGSNESGHSSPEDLAVHRAWGRGFRRRIADRNQPTIRSLVAVGWAVYVRSRLGWTVGVVALSILALFTFRFMRSDWMIGYAIISVVPLSLLLTRHVWLDYFNIRRAISHVVTAHRLLAFAARGPSGEQVQRHVSA